jgi:hypothetical protein
VFIGRKKTSANLPVSRQANARTRAAKHFRDGRDNTDFSRRAVREKYFQAVSAPRDFSFNFKRKNALIFLEKFLCPKRFDSRVPFVPESSGINSIKRIFTSRSRANAQNQQSRRRFVRAR